MLALPNLFRLLFSMMKHLVIGALLVSQLTLAAVAWASEKSGAPMAARASCPALMEQARAADLQTATAQAQRIGPVQIEALKAAAVDGWMQAVSRCDGRDRERAERGLAEARRSVQPTGAGRESSDGAAGTVTECDRISRDAQSLQDLGAAALAERRWPDAASLYRKAADAWDLASEKCPSVQRETARQRRDQSGSDAQNAEFCAPGFHAARELTIQLREGNAVAFGGSLERLSQAAETAWREVAPRCTGAIQSIARDNAQMVRQLRGTSWVPALEATRPPSAADAPRTPPRPSAAPTPAPAAALTAPLAAPQGATPQKAAVVSESVMVVGANRYFGDFKPDAGGRTLSGKGRVEWPNGNMFEGTIVNGKRSGKGLFVWTSGQKYEGDWLNDLPSGSGVMRYANGDVFTGDFVAGEPEGVGRMVYAAGDVYVGPFLAGFPNGIGTYTWRNGQYYKGMFVRSVQKGRGVIRFANGNEYEGDVESGVPEGVGRMRFAFGDIHEGGYVAGLAHGRGTYSWKNGDRFLGEWALGKKTGRGVITWVNGDAWDGEFRNDERTDNGRLIRKGL